MIYYLYCSIDIKHFMFYSPLESALKRTDTFFNCLDQLKKGRTYTSVYTVATLLKSIDVTQPFGSGKIFK